MKEKNRAIEPFFAIGSSVKPTKEEIEKRKIKYQRMLEIGVDTAILREEENENPYRIEAVVLINQGMEVPQDLLIKIKKYDEEYAEVKKKQTVG